MPRQELALNLTTPNGARRIVLSLDPAHMSQRMMIEVLETNQLYESETSNLLGSVLRSGDSFIDIGAHVGYFSMLASALVGSSGRVFSFEPEPRNYAHLLEHIEINGATNVRPLHMAVGAKPSVAEFFVNSDNDGGHALWEVGRHPFNERSREAPLSRRVYLTSLDDLFATTDIGSLKAIKIDAEGAEFAVLVGASQLLRRSPIPFVIAEVNRFALESMGTSEQQLRAFMSDLGYETYLFVPGGSTAQRVSADQTFDTQYVFNVLFRHPEAPALAA